MNKFPDGSTNEVIAMLNERRSHDPVISDVAKKLDEHIGNAGDFWKASMSDRKAISSDVEDIKIALFAKDDKNKFEQPGLMVTARNIDNHINVVCSIASWGWKIVIGALGLLTALKAAGVV
tara:strand:- start:548 stop:910 length:363 start_codon:yes stop_codon:yes gene_type:complete